LARLREARERTHTQDRLRAVGATAAGFCHELATPLNASSLLGGRLRRKTQEVPGTASDPSLAALSADWDELERNLARCERIVRGMAAATWEADALAVRRTDVGLLARKLASEHGGSHPLEVSIPPGGHRVQAPPVSLGQVLLNLLRNAEEASPPRAPS
jgi:signal transduction histidine kinase